MSYYRVFKPTKEALDSMLPKQHVVDYQDIRESLMASCMVQTDMIEARKDIDFSLNYIFMCISAEAIENARRQFEEDGEISYCGWEYRHDCSSIPESDLKEQTKRSLAILKSIVRTPDYFEEHEKFYDKIRDINEIIDEFIDTAYSIANFEVIEKLKDFDVTSKYDESGGCEDTCECDDSGK